MEDCLLVQSIYPSLLSAAATTNTTTNNNNNTCCTDNPFIVKCSNQNFITHLLLNNTLINSILNPILFNLQHLQVLNVSNARLTGRIPKSITNLKQLSVLDLSNNPQLSGELPRKFNRVLSLQHLDLHNTNVSGIIPSFPPRLEQCHLPSQSQFTCYTTKPSVSFQCTFQDSKLTLNQCPPLQQSSKLGQNRSLPAFATFVTFSVLVFGGVILIGLIWYKRRNLQHAQRKYHFGYNPLSKTDILELREPATKVMTMKTKLDLSGCLVYHLDLGSSGWFRVDSSSTTTVISVAQMWRLLFDKVQVCVTKILQSPTIDSDSQVVWDLVVGNPAPMSHQHVQRLKNELALTHFISNHMVIFLTRILSTELYTVLECTSAAPDLYTSLHACLSPQVLTDPPTCTDKVHKYIEAHIYHTLTTVNKYLYPIMTVPYKLLAPVLIQAVTTMAQIKADWPQCALVSVQPNAMFVLDVMNPNVGGFGAQSGPVTVCLFPGILNAGTNVVIERARVLLTAS